MPTRTNLFIAAVLGIVLAATLAHAGAWPDGRELTGRLQDLSGLDRATLHELGRSAGNQKLRLLEIAPREPSEGGGPAVFVVANLEGNLPLCSLAAVELAAEVLVAPEDSPAAAVRWYILPLANPDGLDRWFERPRTGSDRNDTPVDDDSDGFEGEDPPDDLDGNGLITWMLVEDASGNWTLDADGLPIKADAARSIPGRYRRETEGRDDDGDGRFNEDATGGVVVACNFPHGFEPWSHSGLWPGDQPESRAVLDFAFNHPDIAMVMVLGATNNLWTVPEPQPASDPDQPVQLGWRLARDLGLRSGVEYPLSAVDEAVRERGARTNLTPETLRARLHLEPITKPLLDDLGWWGALSDSYHAFLRNEGLDATREVPSPPPAGGAAPWAYFQFGVPAVAIDLWSLPVPADTTAIDSLVTAVSPGPDPDPVHRQLKIRTERDNHTGWTPWTEVVLDDRTRALVGGPEPGAVHTPATYAAPVRSRAMLPFLLDLAGWLPRIEVAPLDVRRRGDSVFEVAATLHNPSRLPYPTAMGAVARRPRPLVVELTGGTPLQSEARRIVPCLPAGGGTTVRWLVRCKDPDRLAVTATSPSLGTATAKGGVR